jgi:hypothetical protein
LLSKSFSLQCLQIVIILFKCLHLLHPLLLFLSLFQHTKPVKMEDACSVDCICMIRSVLFFCMVAVFVLGNRSKNSRSDRNLLIDCISTGTDTQNFSLTIKIEILIPIRENNLFCLSSRHHSA